MEEDIIEVTEKIASIEMNGCKYEDVDSIPMPKEGPTPDQVEHNAGQELEKQNSKPNDHGRDLYADLLIPADEVEAQHAENLRENPYASVTLINQTSKLANILKTSSASYPFALTGLNHVAFCCENLERTLEFYCGLLGLKSSPDRPDLPYRGAWLHLGAEGVHIMEISNPDPVHDRPSHGGFDRHVCINCSDLENLKSTIENAGMPYQLSLIPSVFCRDPDGNGLEFIQIEQI